MTCIIISLSVIDVDICSHSTSVGLTSIGGTTNIDMNMCFTFEIWLHDSAKAEGRCFRMMQADSRGSKVMPNASVIQEYTLEQVRSRERRLTDLERPRTAISPETRFVIVNQFTHDKNNVDDSSAPCFLRHDRSGEPVAQPPKHLVVSHRNGMK